MKTKMKTSVAVSVSEISALSDDVEDVYEIDVEQSRETGSLVVQTSQRQRRANGQWGKVKPLKIKNGTGSPIRALALVPKG